MSLDFESLIGRLKRGISTVELVHVPHERWPLPKHDYTLTRRPQISVLDSSFNPPTLAHLALANTSPPHLHDTAPVSETSSLQSDFDARLLLLSVRNADKTLKSNDATYAQRLEMMILLAKEVVAGQSARASDQIHDSVFSEESAFAEANVAVAIIDEPTFVGKSRILQEYLQNRLSSFASTDTLPPACTHSLKPELTFVVGIDTLERILAVRYYGTEEDMRRSLRQFLSSHGDGSRLICARRVTPGSLEQSDEREQRVSAEVDKYLDPGCMEIVDIGGDVESYSSSEVRQRIAEGDSLWTQMVPTTVAEYITSKGLYGVYAPSNKR